jgi:signal transduction histidine kinase
LSSFLSAITAQFQGGEWQQAVSACIRQSEVQRTHVGAVLHDQVGQILTAVGLQLGMLRTDVPELSEIQVLLESAMAHVRGISRDLNPSAVERAGFRFALEHLVQDQRTHFPADLTLAFPEHFRVPSVAGQALFPIARSAVDLAREKGAEEMSLRVEQNGSAWVLEARYDVSPPGVGMKLAAEERRSLLLLEFDAMRAGLPIVFADSPEGITCLRAAYGVP